MTVAVNLASESGYLIRVSALAPSNPDLFELLMATTSLQPVIDPKAGYGPFQVVRTFLELGIAREHQDMFCEACDNDAYVAYVVLRSVEYRFFDMRTFTDALEARCFRVRQALDHIRKFVPGFGMAEGQASLEASVTDYEGNNADQKAHSGTQAEPSQG